mmetsp:Transcript_24640/g.40871  ORF Transcript_24640/g.40871 Transcript_24640/m.40871 type:complete len:310 (+) Transcript_24640:16-945(+)
MRVCGVVLWCNAACVCYGYTVPGLLAGLVDQKRREVERFRLLPEAREDGSWTLRLAYPAPSASFAIARALGWRAESFKIIPDLKRTSPGKMLGDVKIVTQTLVPAAEIDRAREQGACAALVCIDKASYGGSASDLEEACRRTREAAVETGQLFPIIAKDLIIDPLQIARAAVLGAHAVLLVVAAAPDELPGLLDACTVMGIEALVEVHTSDELQLAIECGASLILVNERDRARAVVMSGQAASLATLLPPDVTCLACGGINSIEQVRTLRRRGFDGAVLGRAWQGPNGKHLVEQIMREEFPPQRIAEII